MFMVGSFLKKALYFCDGDHKCLVSRGAKAAVFRPENGIPTDKGDGILSSLGRTNTGVFPM
jgi:hypothetical protein